MPPSIEAEADTVTKLLQESVLYIDALEKYLDRLDNGLYALEKKKNFDQLYNFTSPSPDCSRTSLYQLYNFTSPDWGPVDFSEMSRFRTDIWSMLEDTRYDTRDEKEDNEDVV